MSPLTILFHSAFQWGNHLATATYVSLVVVMVTGLVGRYLYGLVRLDADHAAQMAVLRGSLQKMLASQPVETSQWADACGAGFRRLVALVQAPTEMAPAGSSLLLGRPGEAWLLRRGIAKARPLFLDQGAYRQFRAQALRLRRFDVKVHFHRRFKRLLDAWRILHVTLSILLLGLIGLHVWISIHVGFRWLWS
jgi:hypothetical protein